MNDQQTTARDLAREAHQLAMNCKFTEAADLLERSLKLASHKTKITLDLAMISVELGRGEQAKDLLLNLLAQNPHNAHALTVLAAAYRRCDKDYVTSETMLRQAFSIAPQDTRVLNGLGGLASTRGDHHIANEWFNLAIEVDPEFPNPRVGLAFSLSKAGCLKASNDVLKSMSVHARVRDVISGVVFSDARWLQKYNLFCLECIARMKLSNSDGEA